MEIEINNKKMVEESEIITALENAGYKIETHYSIQGCFSFTNPEKYQKKYAIPVDEMFDINKHQDYIEVYKTLL